MALNDIPKTMRALVAPSYCKPDSYEIQTLPVPTIVRPHDCLICVHAAGTTTGEALAASGVFRLLVSLDFPIGLGIEGSGVVVAVGSDVKSVKVGDEVVGGRYTRPVFPSVYGGWIAEYTLASEHLLAPKPPNLTFEQAAGMLGSAVTAYQSFQQAFRLMGLPAGSSLEGKTVFVPGALSATGSIGVQFAKNVYGAEKVISTVSTPKLPLVDRHLGHGVVDQVIDYTKQDVTKEVGRGTVDFVYNTQWGFTSTFPLLNPKTGVVVSIASVPHAEALRSAMGKDKIPYIVAALLAVVQWWYDWKLRGTNVQRLFVSGHPGQREDLKHCVELIARGKLRPVSTVVSFDDLEAVRSGFSKVASGKGGLGCLVVKVI